MSIELNPYVHFNGNAREAMEFYQSILGGDLEMQTFAEAGFAESEESEDKIMHAHLESEDFLLMASDTTTENPVTLGGNVHLSISGTDEDELKKIFNKLSEGGKVEMEMEESSWGDTFGMITDKFGIHWMINLFSEDDFEDDELEEDE